MRKSGAILARIGSGLPAGPAEACTRHLIATMIIAAMFSGIAPEAQAQEADIQTIYATRKGACGKGPSTRVEISKGRITGPGFDCALSASRPAGTGLVAYQAACTVDGKKISEGIALDLGNYPDRFELALPGRDGWLALYPCTKVPGLR